MLGGLTGLGTTVDQRYGLLVGEHTSRSGAPDGSGWGAGDWTARGVMT
jgi:hypothetical protein